MYVYCEIYSYALCNNVVKFYCKTLEPRTLLSLQLHSTAGTGDFLPTRA